MITELKKLKKHFKSQLKYNYFLFIMWLQILNINNYKYCLFWKKFIYGNCLNLKIKNSPVDGF